MQKGPANVPESVLVQMDLVQNRNPTAIAAAPLSELLCEPMFPTIDFTVERFSLNLKQEAVVRAVLEHFILTKEGGEPPQLKLAILGEPGVGKSVVATAISWYFERHRNEDWLVVAAFTGMCVFVASICLHGLRLSCIYRKSCSPCSWAHSPFSIGYHAVF